MAGFTVPKLNPKDVLAPSYIKNASFSQPPTPPRNTTPPPAHPPGPPKPVAAPPARPPAPIRGLLPTGNKTPFNVFGIPSTQGGFNKEVNELASASFQPQLNQNANDVSSENALNKVRSQDIANIYNTENAQAKKAFQDAQGAITNLLTQEKGGDAASQGYLSAALGAAGTPGDQLAGMMGQAPTTNAGTLAPFLAAAAGGAGAVGQNLATQQGNQESQLANAEVTPGYGRQQDATTEAQRHEAQLNTLTGNRNTIIAGIPDAIEKASEQLTKDIQAAQNSQFQEGLAKAQFGETAKVDTANIANQKGSLTLAQRKQAADEQNASAQLKLQAQQIANQAAATKVSLETALAKATSQQQANAIKYLTTWATPTAQEMLPGGTSKVTDPKTGNVTTTKTGGAINVKTWHRDAGNALETLMTVYGMNLQSALQLMGTVNVPISGGKGQTVAQWAKTFLQRQAANRSHGVGRGVSKVAGGKGVTL